MDLFGLDLQERRKNAKFTVLRRPGKTWNQGETTILSTGLYPGAVVAMHPRYPEILVIANEHALGAIVAVLGTSDFEYRVLRGWDNPDLPFRAEL